MKKYFATVALLFLVGCAEGEANGPEGPDAATSADARVGGFPDANTSLPDARVVPDANTSFPDASTVVSDSGVPGGSCTTSADCTTAGECCFVAVCVPGTEIPGLGCFPM